MSDELNYDLHDSAGFWVVRLATIWSETFKRMLARYDLTPAQHTVLSTLYMGRGRTPGEIGSYVRRTGAAVTRLLDHLEKKNLVVRKPGPDRRSIIVELTEKGRELAPKCTLFSRQTNEKMMAVLTEEERQQFNATLQKIFEAVGMHEDPSQEN